MAMLRMCFWFAATALTLGAPAQGPAPARGPDPALQPAALQLTERPPPFLLDRGPGQLPLEVPRGEELHFEVSVRYGLINKDVGSVTLSSDVQAFRSSLLLKTTDVEAEPMLESGVVRCHATGGVFGLYQTDALIEARMLPQEWPSLFYSYNQTGSETRRQELRIGLLAPADSSDPLARVLSAEYKRDTDKGAPKGQRIWKAPKTRALPAEAIDMISAIYLARSMVAQGAESIEFALLDKLVLWKVELVRGATSVQEVPAGRFEAVEISLVTSPYQEPGAAEPSDEFSGLFGIKGDIHIWMETKTGVPVRITGTVPLGLDFDADIRLERYKLTPPDFQPLPKEREQ